MGASTYRSSYSGKGSTSVSKSTSSTRRTTRETKSTGCTACGAESPELRNARHTPSTERRRCPDLSFLNPFKNT